MNLYKQCDFCARLDVMIPDPPKGAGPKLAKDRDALWVCFECREKIQSAPALEKVYAGMPPGILPTMMICI